MVKSKGWSIAGLALAALVGMKPAHAAVPWYFGVPGEGCEIGTERAAMLTPVPAQAGIYVDAPAGFIIYEKSSYRVLAVWYHDMKTCQDAIKLQAAEIEAEIEVETALAENPQLKN